MGPDMVYVKNLPCRRKRMDHGVSVADFPWGAWSPVGKEGHWDVTWKVCFSPWLLLFSASWLSQNQQFASASLFYHVFLSWGHQLWTENLSQKKALLL